MEHLNFNFYYNWKLFEKLNVSWKENKVDCLLDVASVNLGLIKPKLTDPTSRRQSTLFSFHETLSKGKFSRQY